MQPKRRDPRAIPAETEAAVRRCLAANMSNRKIARTLGVGRNTIFRLQRREEPAIRRCTTCRQKFASSNCHRCDVGIGPMKAENALLAMRAIEALELNDDFEGVAAIACHEEGLEALLAMPNFPSPAVNRLLVKHSVEWHTFQRIGPKVAALIRCLAGPDEDDDE